jgi:tripartite-type tricarboxylate transporter receptor subunit TctC
MRSSHASRRALLGISTFLAASLAAWPLCAQEFPSRPITIVVPFGPGGGPDVTVRAIAEKLSGSLKQPVVIDYKPGAAGLIGAAFVQKARPDGHTILFSGNSSMVVAPMLRQPAPFDVRKDFAPLSIALRYPMFLIVPPRHPSNTVAEFVAAAKAKPNSVSFGSPGVGTVGHLTTEIFARSAGFKATHVPYKGLGDAQTGVMAGDVQLYLDGPLSSAELLRAGKVKALAVTGDKRISAFPNVPSMKELGYPDVNPQVWVGFFAPRGTPEQVVRRLSEEIARTVKTGEVRDLISQGGLAEAVGNTSAEMAQLIEAEIPAFSSLVKDLNLRAD